MKRKRFRTRSWFVATLLLVLMGIFAFASGKYVQEVIIEGNVTFQATLAADVILQEHKAVRQANGSYALVTQEYANSFSDDEYDEETFVDNNTYILLPGYDVPKDPHIIITDKTSIPAYLFVEVKDTLDVPVTYQMDGNWEEVMDVSGPDGSKVYCYRTVIDNTFDSYPIYILEENSMITVSHNLLNQIVSDGEDVLKFHVKLIQKVGEEDAKTAYGGYSN